MDTYRRSQILRWVPIVLVIIGVVVLGILFLSRSKATTPAVSLQPEQGNPTGKATVVTDPNASGAAAVKFSSTNPGGGDPHGHPAMFDMAIFYGSTHNHTGSGNNHGADNSTAQQVFATAKAHHFDFIIQTEHSGKSGPSSQGMNPATFYNDVKAQAAAYTDASFVGIPGYEYSDNDGGSTGGLVIGKGHMTGANTDEFMNADGSANTGVTLMDYLVSQRNAGKPAYGGFNHPPSSGHPASAPAVLTPARRNVVVMTEIHNSMLSGADNSHLQAMVSELDRGWRVGPTCGLDGHGLFRISMETDPGPCRIGIVAPSLTKQNIDDAFMARRMYSTRDINLQMGYKVNGSWMGSLIGHPTTLNFDINVKDPDTGKASDQIKKIEIVTEHGTVVDTKNVSSYDVNYQVSIPANGKKYFFVKVYNGTQSTYIAAGSPVWLE